MSLVSLCNKNDTAQNIVELLFLHWVSHYGFPLAISSDGATNMTNNLTGEIASLMHLKLYRIAPYNSKAAPAERFNSMALQFLRIFHQSYGLNDDRFAMILSMASLCINTTIQKSGYTPYFLQNGRAPRSRQFISLRSLKTMTKQNEYAKTLIKCQNVCFAISKLAQVQPGSSPPQLPNLYQVGDFVLLKKPPDAVHQRFYKLLPKYYPEPYRIVRRTETNAFLIPYTKEYFKSRLKREGKVHKNLCVMAKVTRLKPVQNPLVLMDLTIDEKIILQFSLSLQESEPDITQVEILEPVPQVNTPDFIQDCNPSVQVLSDDGRILSVSDMLTKLHDLTLKTLDPTQFDEFEPPPCLFPEVPINKKQRFFPTVSLNS